MGNSTSCSLTCNEENVLQQYMNWNVSSYDFNKNKLTNLFTIDSNNLLNICPAKTLEPCIIFFDKINESDCLELIYSFNSTNAKNCLIYITLIDVNVSTSDILDDMTLIKGTSSLVNILLNNGNGYIGIDKIEPHRKFTWTLGDNNIFKVKLNKCENNKFSIKQSIKNKLSDLDTYHTTFVNKNTLEKVQIILMFPDGIDPGTLTKIKLR